MFLIRDIMYCKPGQARPMVQKFLALSKLGKQMGFGDAGVPGRDEGLSRSHPAGPPRNLLD